MIDSPNLLPLMHLLIARGVHCERHFGTTPIYRLNLNTFAIKQVATTGDSLGWIYEHHAKRVDRTVVVRGGKVALHNGEKEVHEENTVVFQLDLPTGRWSHPS